MSGPNDFNPQCIKTCDDNVILQNAINAMAEWSIKWQLVFNGEKCSMLHLGKNNNRHKYTINHNNKTIDFRITNCEKDLGVSIDPLNSKSIWLIRFKRPGV